MLAGIREVRPLPPEDDEVPESSQQGQPTAISAMRPPSMRLSAQDRRFNISFTLAGVGTFSNLFGAFGGQQGR